jgi:hypothetical protein
VIIPTISAVLFPYIHDRYVGEIIDSTARAGRPKDDTQYDTQLPPALTCATTDPAWDLDDTPLYPTDDPPYDRPVPMDETFEDVHLPSFEVEIEVESSNE